MEQTLRRVVVTGLGAITPVGNTVEEMWANLKAGVHGIAPITLFDTTDYKTKIGAEVKNFDPRAYMDMPHYNSLPSCFLRRTSAQ